MKQLLVAAWAWICAHPSEVLSALVGLISSIAALSIYNARQRGKPVGILAVTVDRLAARTRADAANKGWSLPGIGKSIFDEVQLMKAEAEAKANERAEQPKPDASRSSEPGFASIGVLRALAAVVAIVVCIVGPVLSLASCAGTAPPVLSPVMPRVVHRPEWGTCVEAGGKIELPQTGVMAMLTSACFAPMDSGIADASVGAEASLDAEPEPVIPDKIQDAGVLE